MKSLAGKKGRIKYYFNDASFAMEGGSLMALPVNKDERKFLKKKLKEVDQLTGLEFEEVESKKKADIDFYQVKNFKNGAQVGEARKLKGQKGFEVFWKNRGAAGLSGKDKSIMSHELAHTFGLDHPNNNPFSRRFDTCDTVMSYIYGGCSGFSKLDSEALADMY